MEMKTLTSSIPAWCLFSTVCPCVFYLVFTCDKNMKMVRSCLSLLDKELQEGPSLSFHPLLKSNSEQNQHEESQELNNDVFRIKFGMKCSCVLRQIPGNQLNCQIRLENRISLSKRGNQFLSTCRRQSRTDLFLFNHWYICFVPSCCTFPPQPVCAARCCYVTGQYRRSVQRRGGNCHHKMNLSSARVNMRQTETNDRCVPGGWSSIGKKQNIIFYLYSFTCAHRWFMSCCAAAERQRGRPQSVRCSLQVRWSVVPAPPQTRWPVVLEAALVACSLQWCRVNLPPSDNTELNHLAVQPHIFLCIFTYLQYLTRSQSLQIHANKINDE